MTPEPIAGRRAHAHDDPSVAQLVSYLKERVYVSFISLAVLLALSTHPSETSPVLAIGTLVIAAVGAALAGLVSEIIAHLAVHGTLPGGADLRHLLRVSSGALATVVLPAVVLLLAELGLLDIETALTVAVALLAVTLGAVAFLSVARAKLAWWKKLAVSFVVLVLGVLVIAVQVLAHG
jgi:hypothetical protein